MQTLDGRYSATLADVGLLMGEESWNHADGVASTLTDATAAEIMAGRGRMMVSAGIQTPASNIQAVLRVRGQRPASIQPVWDNIAIEDIYTSSGNGLVRFTAIVLADFSCQQPAAYSWLKSRHA